jgi:teichuronic acid exporter
MSLKDRAISGALWSSFGRFVILALELVVGIILARLLSPEEFGLVGMIAVFLAISEIFINSGFSQALIRKIECSEEDFSTAFIYNFLGSFFIFTLLYFFAPYISDFFEQQQLTAIIRVLGFGLFITALGFVQRTKLTRRIEFKLLSKISVYSSFGSGILSILVAIYGFGVWSLVAKTISRDLITCILLWRWSKWKPIWVFSKKSFKELFGFGSKLLISGLLGTFTNNFIYVILGKYFNISDVGYYNRAELFKNIPSQNMESIITGVGYPVMAKLQNDSSAFSNYFKKILKTSAFLIIILMAGLMAVSENLVLFVLGVDWATSGDYLFLLCPIGALYPLWTINLNVFNIIGRSDIYLKMQFFNQLLTVISVLIASFYSVKMMIVLLTITSLLSYILYAINAQKYTGYKLVNQLRDLVPFIVISLLMFTVVTLLGNSLSTSLLLKLIIQIFTGILVIVLTCEILKIKEYILLKEIIQNIIP